jgi:putative ABC transport system permease protein
MSNAKDTKPPALPQRILLRFLRDDLAEEVSGDLEEKFYSTLKEKSLFQARLNYWYQVIHYLRPFAIRNAWSSNKNSFSMYRSYFKTAYRNMVKNKLHSFINITGLSVGMAVAITIGLWIWDELSYNKDHEHYERIAQVIQNVTNNGEVQTWRSIPYPLAEELRKNYGSDFREVALSTQLFDRLFDAGEKKVNRPGLFAEPSLAQLLSLTMVKGTRDALKDPSSILISFATAKASFGDADPLNQTIKLDDEIALQVGGVYEDIPENSTFAGTAFIAPWQALLNNTDWIRNMHDPWRPNAFVLFVQLADHASFTTASEKIKYAKLNKVNTELAKKKPELFLDPMNRWHLYSEFKDGKNAGGRIRYVWLFGVIGGFVLLMACINFMNLSTARSEKRAKEVGIRRAIGSLRTQLIAQFFSESILMALLALVCSLLLVQLVLPAFNAVADKQMSLLWTSPVFWLLCLGFSLFTGLIAGSYPALYLSSVGSGSALKGVVKAGGAAVIPRKVLVVVQFTVSVVLIIGTSVVFRQVQFAKNRPLGYESSGLLAVPVSYVPEIHKHFDVVKAELEKNEAIVAMAEASAPTTGTWSSSSGFDWEGKDPNLSVDFPVFSISHDYGSTIGWEIAKGRDFSREFLSDSSAVILNEAAVNFMGLQEPVGEILRWNGQAMTIIGVASDMITTSPYDPVKPAVYFLSNGPDNYAILKINPRTSAAVAIARIEETFKKFSGDQPFEYQFIDDSYAKKFGNEERIGTLSTYFAVLAIFISCLGIFGLASFVAEQRTKEIGVRKVLGASIFDLWKMLSGDFVLLVVFSCTIAVPIAYYLLNEWLEGYQYRTGIPLWICVAASLGTLAITLTTVSFHTIQAARMNPVKSLRTE